MKKAKKTGAARAIEGFGNSATRMTKALAQEGLKTITRQGFEKLAKDNKPLPAQFVPQVSKMTNIPKKDLNGEVDWELAKETP